MVDERERLVTLAHFMDHTARVLAASFIPIQFRLKERDLSDAFEENP
jgi:hypothetical protein